MAATMMPPTTHALPHAQRAHLIRSTRKLGNLLGETPLLVESSAGAQSLFGRSHSRSASTMSTESRRSARIFMSSPRTSSGPAGVLAFPDATVHAEASPTTTAISRPMLLLRLPSPDSALSPTTAECTTPLPSPLSPTFGLALNSPATPPPTLDTSRRRKMAKLMRTLGENVPPELVFPTAAPGLTPKARRRASTLSVPESMRERHLAHTQSAPSIAVEEPDAPFSYPSTVPVEYVTESVRRSMDTSSDSSSEYLLPNPHDGDSYMHRREQGWSGEWGGKVSNMEDVVRSLRGLKMK